MPACWTAAQLVDSNLAQNWALVTRMFSTTADDENRTPAGTGRFPNELPNPVASNLGAKPMQVAGAFRVNIPSCKRPDGLVGDAIACPREAPILPVDDERVVLTDATRRTRIDGLVRFAGFKQYTISALSERRHISEFLRKESALLLAKIEPYS
jgi:hypothetical protein